MEIINHECYVSLEVAKLLKEAGFDWEVYSLYQCYPEEDVKFLVDSFCFNYNIHSNIISAPTLDAAQRWLRENYNMHILIDCIGQQNWLPTIQYMEGSKDIIVQDNAKLKMCSNYDGYDTYEEAQEAGIKKALEIILEKWNKRKD